MATRIIVNRIAVHTGAYEPPKEWQRNTIGLAVVYMHVLGEVLNKTTLPYLERAAGVVHSRLLLYKPHCTIAN